MIQTASCSIQALFEGEVFSKHEDDSEVHISGQLAVPVYQRPYVWGVAEVDRLLADLEEHFKGPEPDRPDFYLGSIILHQQGQELNIIDGQQRLTTLALMLSAADQTAPIPAFNFSNTDSIRNIRFNYHYLQAKMPGLQELLPKLREAVNVTLVVTDNQDDAYTFFETQNTGGVRLSGVDIIKAHHLRAIPEESHRGPYAISWERQNTLHQVCTLLLKARYWTRISGKDVPGRRHTKALKKAIVAEFSERTREREPVKVGYVHAQIAQAGDGWQVNLPKFPYAIRQPLYDGEQFMDYLTVFCGLYETIFPYGQEKTAPGSYERFISTVIGPVDGTLFSKELFEISLLCYAHRFGTTQLYEAALWIFRYAYAIRLTHEKTNREDAVPVFLRQYPLLDLILRAFDHQDLLAALRPLVIKVDGNYLEGNTVKSRYLDRLGKFFDADFHIQPEAIDALLQLSIYQLFPKS